MPQEVAPAEPAAPERTPTKAAEAAVDEMIETAKSKVEETQGKKKNYQISSFLSF